MRYLIKFIILISVYTAVGCERSLNTPEQTFENQEDSISNAQRVKIQDVNEGVKKGYDESKEEFREKSEKLMIDSIKQ